MVPIPDDDDGDGAMAELLDNEDNEDGTGTARKWSGIDGKKEGKGTMEWSELSSLDDSEDDTRVTRSRAPHNSHTPAAPPSLMQPTTTPSVANWHPINAFSACNHTCEHTNSQLSRRSQPLRECPVWLKDSSGMLRHAKNPNSHMDCEEDCPAHDERKEPVFVRDVNQAEWTKWAEVLFDELHGKLDRDLGKSYPHVKFNCLEDWVVPIPDDSDAGVATILPLDGPINGGEGEDRRATGTIKPLDVGGDGKEKSEPEVYSLDNGKDGDGKEKRGPEVYSLDNGKDGNGKEKWGPEVYSLENGNDVDEKDGGERTEMQKVDDGGAMARPLGHDNGSGEVEKGKERGRAKKRVNFSESSEDEDSEVDRRGKRHRRAESSYDSEDRGRYRRRKKKARKRPRVYSSDDSEDDSEDEGMRSRHRRGKSRRRADYERDRRTKRRRAKSRRPSLGPRRSEQYERVSSSDSSDYDDSVGDKRWRWRKAQWTDDEDDGEDEDERDRRRKEEKRKTSARKRFRADDSDSEDEDEVDRRKRRRRKGKARRRVRSPSRSDGDIEADEGRREKRNPQEVDRAKDFAQLPFAEIADRPSTPPPAPPRTPLLALAHAFIRPFSYLFAPAQRS
ncbi:hypothetical protein BD779DRAFT_1566532 [Infundibulicybe gibba]|nr:hypothetical protein BD779DRAFT_1566532 [Infundibulicybe gibba]